MKKKCKAVLGVIILDDDDIIFSEFDSVNEAKEFQWKTELDNMHIFVSHCGGEQMDPQQWLYKVGEPYKEDFRPVLIMSDGTIQRVSANQNIYDIMRTKRFKGMFMLLRPIYRAGIEIETNSFKEETPQYCPFCDVKLVKLNCKIPSGHTHQCPECGSLHAPFGRD